MNAHNLRIWGLIQAEIAHIEAMKAANHERFSNGYAQAYGEQSFEESATELKRLAESFTE
jgi:hypothetical protein